MENPSAVFYGKEDIRIEDRPVPEPSPQEVEVTMFGVTLCGTDIHHYSDGRYGDSVMTSPNVIGHEGCGRITKVGSDVTEIKVGDRVALEPGDRCYECKRCRQGRHNTCLVNKPWAQPLDGYIARKKVVKHTACHKLPASVTNEEGCFMEPLAVAVHACRRAEVSVDKSVLIQGAGSIGQLCMMTALAMGATNVLITDVIKERLEVASHLGAPNTYVTESRDVSKVEADVVAVLGEQPDVTLECSGNMWCQQFALRATAAGGTVMFVGLSRPDIDLPISVAARREVDMKTIYRYTRDCFPIAIHLVAQGKVKLAPLISHRFPLQETETAFKVASGREPGVLKVFIDCQK